jgi:hypothetical protein
MVVQSELVSLRLMPTRDWNHELSGLHSGFARCRQSRVIVAAAPALDHGFSVAELGVISKVHGNSGQRDFGAVANMLAVFALWVAPALISRLPSMLAVCVTALPAA